MKTTASLLFIIFSATVVSGQVEVTSTGNVGIGTTNPQAALDLGSATSGRALTWGGSSGNGRYASIFAPYSSGGIVLSTGFHGDDGSDSYLSSYTGSMSRSAIRLNSFGESAGNIQFYTNPASAVTAGDPITPTERMRITASGNVGIGTTSPSHKLQVTGPVRATSFISDTATYADFVFAPDYRLAPLSEVEAHIRDKGHLPDIPSEEEARANGIDLATMQVKLLQKIEELTLHVIAQEKRIQKLELENQVLRNSIQ